VAPASKGPLLRRTVPQESDTIRVSLDPAGTGSGLAGQCGVAAPPGPCRFVETGCAYITQNMAKRQYVQRYQIRCFNGISYVASTVSVTLLQRYQLRCFNGIKYVALTAEHL
jgi:hypothetical protein